MISCKRAIKMCDVIPERFSRYPKWFKFFQKEPTENIQVSQLSSLNLIFKNDILCLLYYVCDIHASVNVTNTH